MIKAIYDRGKHSLSVTGHAGSAPVGEDLVCAAASILAYTLAEAVSGLEEAGDKLSDMHISIGRSGHAEINCMPLDGYRAIVTLIFDTVCNGYALLHSQHPENISFEIVQ